MILSKKRINKELIRLHICAGWSALLLFANHPKKDFLKLPHILNIYQWFWNRCFYSEEKFAHDTHQMKIDHNSSPLALIKYLHMKWINRKVKVLVTWT